MRHLADIPYAQRDKADLCLDAWLPESAADLRRTILFAHGGGFRKGRRKGHPAEDLAARLVPGGAAVLSASYRVNTSAAAFPAEDRRRIRAARLRSQRVGLSLSPSLCGPAFMAAVEDLSEAVGWARADAGRLGLRGPVAMIGVSAGAIAGAALIHPPAGWEERLNAPDALIALTGAVVQPWRLAAGRAPILMFHGSADRIIPPTDIDLAERRARAKGADLTVLRTGVRGHNRQIGVVLDGCDPDGQPWFARITDLLGSLGNG